MPLNGEKKKSRIEQLPEETRKMILIISITVLTLVIFSFWVISLKTTLKPIEPDPEAAKEFEEFQESLSSLLEQTQEQFSELEQIIEELQDSSDAVLTEQDIEKIKQNLLAKEIANWQIYQNQEHGYEIKYPTSTVELVVDKIFEGGTKGNPSFKINNIDHLTIGVWDNNQQLNAKSWLDSQYAESSNGWLWDFEEIEINNQEAYDAIRLDDCYLEWILIPTLSKIYTFRIETCESDSSQSIQIFKNIVSTFKLISPIKL